MSLRRRLDNSGPPMFTDVVGEVVGQTDDAITVQPDDGPVVRVAREHIVALREIPPRAVRPASSPQRLARFLATHWPGTESVRLGGWLLRAGGGFTQRANSALAVGDPGCDERDARDQVVQWYAERGLPPRMLVLGRPVKQPGWSAGSQTEVLVGDLQPARSDHPGQMEFSESPSSSWLDLWRGGAGHDPVAHAVLTASPALYGTLSDQGHPVGCARLVLDRRWAHVSCVEISPEWRGRGRGRAVMAATIARAVSGADRARFIAVEVGCGNQVASALYASLGLRVHHRYHYLTAETV